MTIKVRLGEVKTQEEKPFPKLMINEDMDTIIEVLEAPSEIGIAAVVHRTGVSAGGYTKKFQLINGGNKFTDYNEPITLQNI